MCVLVCAVVAVVVQDRRDRGDKTKNTSGTHGATQQQRLQSSLRADFDGERSQDSELLPRLHLVVMATTHTGSSSSPSLAT